jgi:hypothetical protein
MMLMFQKLLTKFRDWVTSRDTFCVKIEFEDSDQHLYDYYYYPNTKVFEAMAPAHVILTPKIEGINVHSAVIKKQLTQAFKKAIKK